MTRVLVATLVCVLVAGARSGGAQNAGTASLDAVISAASTAAYNLDTGAAIVSMRRAVAAAPGESRAHRALASALWLDILFRRGAVTVDAYLGGVTRGALSLPKPPADLDAEFKREIEQAIDLAGQRVARNSRDVQARYDLGSAYGLQASYFASVEGSTGSAFMAARRAFDAQETVLREAPQLAGAGVVTGSYRYLVSSLGLTARMFAYVAGFGGGKERGISLLESAARTPDAHVEAKTALVLIFSREGRHDEASRLLHELAAEFPRNRIFVLEEAAADIRAKHPAEAEALLTRGLLALDQDARPKLPGERAIWLWKRALARMGASRRLDAATDLQLALSSGPPEWIRGRIAIAEGKLADLNGDRPRALEQYGKAKTIAQAVKDPAAESEAARLLSKPWTQPARP